MAARSPFCPHCGAEVSATATECGTCGRALTVPPSKAPRKSAATRARPPTPTDGHSAELIRRIARLKQWQESAQPLGVALPTLPSWAEDAMRTGPSSDAWLDVVRGVERLAQKKVVTALEAWEKAARNRLSRLEAYAVDGRLERDQIDEALHSARQGEISPALQAFQQVDRVVALKERHLDQAREELERLVSLLRDMEALELAPPVPPSAAGEELERELRSGRLAPLKQRLRALRLQAVNRLHEEFPRYVTEYGTFLVKERSEGTSVELEATELARAAHAFVKGRPEEALHRLRVLQQVHGSSFGRAASRGVGENPTGSSREA